VKVVLTIAALSLALGCGGASPPPASAQGGGSPFDSTPPEPSLAITPEMGHPNVGDEAPDFELTDQDGNKKKLSSFRGKIVLLAFVTSWCPFSEAEQPHLAKLGAEFASDERVKVLAVDVKEDDAGYGKYLARVKMPLPVLRDQRGDVALSYVPPGAQPAFKDRASVLVTSNLVIDQEGKIRFFTLVDTVHFDARLVHARRAIDALLARGAK
jgi:peroxiredoxin